MDDSMFFEVACCFFTDEFSRVVGSDSFHLVWRLLFHLVSVFLEALCEIGSIFGEIHFHVAGVVVHKDDRISIASECSLGRPECVDVCQLKGLSRALWRCAK